MSDEIVKTSVDPTQFPEAAHKHAQRALREHERAEKNAMRAVEHVVKSGQALLKAYDLCEHGQWIGFFELHFKQKTPPDDANRPLTLRTAQKYMQLARDWSQLLAQNPGGFSSQRQAFKALAAIARAEEPKRIHGKSAARGANGGDGLGKGAARGANGGDRDRSGPVWRASGPFVEEALELVTSVDATLDNLVSRGYPLEPEADKVHATLERLERIYNREIDEAEALQAAGEWTFVVDQAPPANTRPVRSGSESEDDHDQ